jgi:two-component system, sensor histidine kinase and response regulator
VEFDSSPGQGTTFRIVLPERPAEMSETGMESPHRRDVMGAELTVAAKAPLSTLRILLAEDNPVNQQVVLGMLRKWGQTAAIASNGREVLAALERDTFDVILMDVQMPEMDGLETTSRIRTKEMQVGGHLRIVAMTGHAMKGDRDRCLAAGMDDYLSKPIKSDDLYAVLQRVRGTVPSPEDKVRTLLDRPKLPRHSVGEVSSQKPILNPDAVTRLRRLADDGGASFLAMVVDAFLLDSKRRLADLREAAAGGDPDGLRKTAHALKGAASEFGALRVTEICQFLEDMGGNQTTEGAAGLIARLGQDLEDVHAELQRQAALVPS